MTMLVDRVGEHLSPALRGAEASGPGWPAG
jgi:hypothetical protein